MGSEAVESKPGQSWRWGKRAKLFRLGLEEENGFSKAHIDMCLFLLLTANWKRQDECVRAD